jgi:hypothetical protein
MSFQQAVEAWTVECFGEEVANDKTERSYRFIEEAIELVQATGTTKEDVLKWVDYVYSRPVGKTEQEVGGVMITLAALCAAHDIDMKWEGWLEFRRIDTPELMEKIRAKQVTKRVITEPRTVSVEAKISREQLMEKLREARESYLDGGGSMYSLEEINLAHNNNVDPGEVRTGYMCLVDFDCELGEQGPDNGPKVYPSLETLRETRTCIPLCGWAKVAVIKLEQEAGDYAAKCLPDVNVLAVKAAQEESTSE